MTDLTEIVNNLRNSISVAEQDKQNKIDAARYRYLRSKIGPDFDLEVDAEMQKDGYIDLPRGTLLGVGGAMFQKVNRDTSVFAVKCPILHDFGPRGVSDEIHPSVALYNAGLTEVIPGDFRKPMFLTDPPYVTVKDMRESVPTGTQKCVCGTGNDKDDGHAPACPIPNNPFKGLAWDEDPQAAALRTTDHLHAGDDYDGDLESEK